MNLNFTAFSVQELKTIIRKHNLLTRIPFSRDGKSLKKAELISELKKHTRWDDIENKLYVLENKIGKLDSDGYFIMNNKKPIWWKTVVTLGHGIIVKASTIPGAGYGLFATKNFKKGEGITEYDGEIISRSYANILKQQNLDTHIVALSPGRSAINGLTTITVGRGGAQFSNDINDKNRYNAVFGKTEHILPGLQDNRTGLKDLFRIFLKAKKDIKAGDEIFVDYGKTTRNRLLGL